MKLSESSSNTESNAPALAAPAKPSPWQYPNGIRPRFFDLPGPAWSDGETTLLLTLFYAKYASHVPGLASLGKRSKGDESLLNPNNMIVKTLVLGWLHDCSKVVGWSSAWCSADVDAVILDTAGIVHRGLTRNFDPARGSLEAFFYVILGRAARKWAYRRIRKQMKLPEARGLDGDTSETIEALPDEATPTTILMGIELTESEARIREEVINALKPKTRAEFEYFTDGLAKPGGYTRMAIAKHGSAWESMSATKRKAAVAGLRKRFERMKEKVIATLRRLNDHVDAFSPEQL